MSDPGGRPGAGKKLGSSWTSRLHQKHKNKHHSNVSEEEVAPLLAADNDDVEDQPNQPTQQEQQNPSERIFNDIRKRTTPILAAFAILLAMTVTGLSIAWAIDNRGHGGPSFCLSADCSDAATRIFKNLSPNYTEIDPCTDFQQYACGGFQEHHKLRPDQSRLGTLSIMAEDTQRVLRHVLEKGVSDIQATDRANFKKLKADYNACMDETKIKSYGLTPLRAVTDHIRAIYPVEASLLPLRNSMSQLNIRPAVTDITNALIYLTSIGVESLLQFYVGADDKHPDDEVIFTGPPGRIGLPSKEYYKIPKLLSEYQEMIHAVLPHFLGAHPNETFALGRQGARLSTPDIISGLVSFESNLAEARPDEVDLEDVLKAYNPTKTSELQHLVPRIAFDKILRELAPSGHKAKYVIVSSPSYLQNMSKIVDATPKQVVQAFLIWKIIQAYSSRVEDPIIEPLRRFFNRLDGKEPDAKEERWRTCIRSCDNTLGWTLSKFYVDEAFSPEKKQFGDKIIDDIKDSFIDLLRNAHWMEQSVRDIAEKKVAAIDKKIGYPVSNPDILDAKALEKYYSTLEISVDKHFENGLHAAQFEVSLDWAKLGKPTRHDEWGMSAPTVNAYYNPAGNEIVFPAGIMQAPVFYGPDVPQYLTYGAFAAVAGQ
jgi:endothelin-converting enzyme